MPEPLRLMLYDRTAGALTASWWAGARIYRGLGRIDAWHGAETWEDGLGWLATFGGSREIGQIQYWGHGTSGAILMQRVPLDVSALDRAHPFQERLSAIRARLAGPGALWWFRTCSTFHGEAGHAFARAWTAYFGCRAAGHTRIIGPLQGGLHALAPGETPGWSIDEGRATSRIPQWMTWAPNTITCFGGKVPEGW